MGSIFWVFLKAIVTFAISFLMGMLGFVLGAFIWVGVSEYLIAMEDNHEMFAKALAFLCLYGAAIVGGIFGLQKGARWTGLFDRPTY